MSLIDVREGQTTCADPDCGGRAEAEQDGDHSYYSCIDCGFEFGYERIQSELREVDSCAIGVPESVRKAASGPMEQAIAQEQKKGPVNLGRTISMRPQ